MLVAGQGVAQALDGWRNPEYLEIGYIVFIFLKWVMWDNHRLGLSLNVFLEMK
jgi:hypothetical protein